MESNNLLDVAVYLFRKNPLLSVFSVVVVVLLIRAAFRVRETWDDDPYRPPVNDSNIYLVLFGAGMLLFAYTTYVLFLRGKQETLVFALLTVAFAFPVFFAIAHKRRYKRRRRRVEKSLERALRGNDAYISDRDDD